MRERAIETLRSALSDERVVMIAAFVILRAVEIAHSPTRFPDTGTYLPLNFLGYQERLWTVPLAYTLFPTGDLRVFAQFLAGVISWSALALSLRMVLTNRAVARGAMVGAFLLGLAPTLAGWDNILLSEGLSSSLLVGTIALLIMASVEATDGRIIAILAVATLWMFTRQANVVIFLSLLLPCVAFTLLKFGRGRRGLAITTGLVLIALWGGFAITRSGSDGVTEWNSLQILENRIATDPSALAYFRARGLPPSPHIAIEKGNFTGSGSPLFQDQRLTSWVNGHFKATYAGYLLQDLPHTLAKPLDVLPVAVSESTESDGTARAVLPVVVTETVWGTADRDLLPWLAIAVALGVLVWARRLTIRCRPLIGLLALTVVVGSILTWTLTGYVGGSELARLFMPIAIAVRIGILLIIAVCADALCFAQRAGARPPGSTVHPASF
jgi:hypothetical protein